MVDTEKRHSNQLIGKKVVSKTGKVFGEINNILFEQRTGEILQLIMGKTTPYCEGLELEKTKNNESLLPFSAVIALGDFVVISEEDIL